MKLTALFLIMLALVTSGCSSLPPELREIGAPVIQTFEASPAVINAGDTASLRWSTSNSQSVSIDNGIGDVAINGTITVSPPTTTFYTLTAKNSMGTISARTQIIVQPAASSSAPQTAPRIILFTADRTSITKGEYATIRWTVQDSTSVTINPVGNVDSSGELRVYPSETTTFTLTASNTAGNSTMSQTVTVLGSTSQQSGKE